MTIADVLLLDFDTEISNTRRTLERLPDTLDPEWTPHAKSMKVGKLAMHCATLPVFAVYIVEDPGMDMMAPTRPRIALDYESREHALATLDDFAAQARAAIAGASDEALAAPWPFGVGANPISSMPRHTTIRLWFLNHLIHHTAQLGVYLRLLDIPVPALYGPSADEQWSPK